MWNIGKQTLNSRFFLGTAQYPSPHILFDAIAAAEAEVVTVSLRRQLPGQNQHNDFWQLIQHTGCRVLPNTAGCTSAREAITTAMMAREVFDTPWIKLEVTGDDLTLQPDPFELLQAAKVLINEGFEVFPYCTDDLVLCQRLVDIGCTILMPWGAPIGSGRGLINLHNLRLIRQRLAHVNLLVDAGIGSPQDACQAMELGFDGVLLNSAVAHAGDPVVMARAFKHAIMAGRLAYEAGIMAEHEMAVATTPVVGKPFWHQVESS